MASDVVVTGIGITAAIGQGRQAFTRALLDGAAGFGVMQRAGRQHGTAFIGAELGPLTMPQELRPEALRHASWPTQVALATVHEAWHDAGLGAIDPRRIGLIVGGSNFQQRDQTQTRESYAGREQYVRPTYGFAFMDTDCCGACTAQFGIRGLAYTVGGASASGQLAIIQAAQAVQSAQVDACIAVGALMDLSHWECQALRSLGAMGSDRYADEPARASRPFDETRDGFIYGEACGALVVERAAAAEQRGVRVLGRLAGWSVAVDGNRHPDPSLDGEMAVIAGALGAAGWTADTVHYVNPHGSGSVLGDRTELAALKASGLTHAFINATKSITGHGLTAAGAVEAIATLVQLQAGLLHPTRNLDNPLDSSFNWVRDTRVAHPLDRALTLSMGFGGINTAVCIQRW